MPAWFYPPGSVEDQGNRDLLPVEGVPVGHDLVLVALPSPAYPPEVGKALSVVRVDHEEGVLAIARLFKTLHKTSYESVDVTVAGPVEALAPTVSEVSGTERRDRRLIGGVGLVEIDEEKEGTPPLLLDPPEYVIGDIDALLAELLVVFHLVEADVHRPLGEPVQEDVVTDGRGRVTRLSKESRQGREPSRGPPGSW